jgi:hypothetical protein
VSVYAAPFTPASEEGAPFVPCDAYRTLLRQIQSYARGELTGQSILVAGHRGSGKTTVAMRAIEDVQRQWAKVQPTDDVSCAKPFPVYLHGPDLQPNNRRNGNDLTAHILAEFTRALHRALTKEVADQFRICLAGTPGADVELAHRIRLELDGFPTAGRLRQCWDAAGLLATGIFPMRPVRDGAALGSTSPGHILASPSMDQGMREIVAIDSLTCVRKALGDDHGGDQREPAGPLPIPRPSRDSLAALSPLASLGSGLAVTLLGIGVRGFDATVSALAGLATTAVSYLFLHLATGLPKSQTLLSHNEVSSLNRALPTLIVRIRDMGLVPIFVVDELDKVTNLPGFFDWLMRLEKGFLADRAFCCYLVNRQYYEELSARIRPQVHPVESTYFGQRVLIHYKPGDMLEFVRTAWEVSSEETDWPRDAALRFAVLMSGCHPGKLQQVRDTYTRKNEQFRLPTESRAETGIAIAVLMQVAIEFVFRHQGTRQHLRLESGFGHTVLDVLYYPARCWSTEEGDGSELAVSRDALVAYLRKHTDLNYASGDLASEYQDLERKLTRVTAYLQDPKGLFKDIEAEGEEDKDLALDSKVADLFESSARIPLERIEERPCVLRWRFDQFGYPLTPYARMEALERELLAPPAAAGRLLTLADWALAFDQGLREISNPRDKAGKLLGQQAPFGLTALLNSIVAPKPGLSWESAITAAYAVQARHETDNADVLVPQVWEATQQYGNRMRAALLGALLADPGSGTFATRLAAFVEANQLQPGTPDGNEDKAFGALNAVVDKWPREDEPRLTLYSQAVRQSALKVGFWLQRVRDLAAYLRPAPAGREPWTTRFQ